LANILMLGLLSLNAITYKILGGSVVWRGLFIDLALGLLLPGAGYLITQISDDVLMRSLISILIIGLVIYISVQDQKMMTQLRSLTNQASKRTSEKLNKII